MLNIILSPEEIGSVTAYIRNLNKIALEDYVLSPKGCLSTDGNGDPNPHETLGVPPCRPKEYFYSFTNDAWQTYDNIRGSVRLTTRQNRHRWQRYPFPNKQPTGLKYRWPLPCDFDFRDTRH